MTKPKRRRVGQIVHLALPSHAKPMCGSRGSRMVTVAQGDWSMVTCPKCRASMIVGAAVQRRFGGL